MSDGRRTCPSCSQGPYRVRKDGRIKAHLLSNGSGYCSFGGLPLEFSPGAVIGAPGSPPIHHAPEGESMGQLGEAIEAIKIHHAAVQIGREKALAQVREWAEERRATLAGGTLEELCERSGVNRLLQKLDEWDAGEDS